MILIFFLLSEAKSGYIWKMIIYVGNETGLIQNADYGHATRVVLTLMEDLLDKGYSVYADNFYCSPELALALTEKSTDYDEEKQKRIASRNLL